MQEILISLLGKVPTLQDLIVAVLTIVGALVVLATALVRIPALQKYSKDVNNFSTKFFDLMAKLPTFGINPQTKKLKEAYDELKAKDDTLKIS